MPKEDRVAKEGTEHRTVLLKTDGNLFQGLCLCGWMSLTSFREEADLLRAMHAHAVVTFGSYA